jgi:outer membrane protein insertion porin family
MSACAVDVRASADPRSPASLQQEGQDTCGGSGARPTLVRRAGAQPPPETRREADGNDAGDKATVKFEGLKTLAEKDVLYALRARNAGVCESFDYDPAKVEHAVRILKEYLASRGFLHATVDVREELVATPKVVTFVINEGERAHIAEIHFEGNKGVPNARLVEEVQACLDRSADSLKEEKGLYDADRLDYCLGTAARQLLSSEGYLQAKVGKPRTEEVKRGLIITVPVAEGLRYRLGKIKIEDATVFLPEQIIEMLDVKTGKVVDGEKIMEWLSDRVAGEYLDRGYVQYEAFIDPVFKTPASRKDEGVVDLRIYIQEGKPFTVASIEFEGNRLKTDEELKSAFSLEEGDVFSRRKFLDGLERLHQLGVFDGFFEGTFNNSRYKGVDFSFNDQEKLISIKIKIDESNR